MEDRSQEGSLVEVGFAADAFVLPIPGGLIVLRQVSAGGVEQI